MQVRPLRALSIIGREALRIVLPAWCVVCEKDLPWRSRTASCCGECWAALPVLSGAKCRSCAQPLPGMTADALCIACGVNPLPVIWSDAWGEYRAGMERVLHAFKFERHDFLADPLARLLEGVVTRHSAARFDVVVPVPMHRAKERRRGYNQAELLAVSLGRRLGVRCDRRLLTKSSERATQSTLARAARAANVRDVFAGHDRLRGLDVLLVDDISTTGETFRACAEELLRHGAASVAAVAVAKAT